MRKKKKKCLTGSKMEHGSSSLESSFSKVIIASHKNSALFKKEPIRRGHFLYPRL